MEAGFFIYIIQYVFMVMALHAQLALLGLAGCVVTLVAVLFIFLVTFDNRARHQKRFQGICVASRCDHHNRDINNEPETGGYMWPHDM